MTKFLKFFRLIITNFFVIFNINIDFFLSFFLCIRNKLYTYLEQIENIFK